MTEQNIANRIACKNIDINASSFHQTILLELEKLLEDVIGYEESKSFISMVADKVGELLYNKYKVEINDEAMTLDTIAHVLVDLKRRIGGRFRVSEVSKNAIVLLNTKCPFGVNVVGKRPLCSMTANVFGKIVSTQFSYAAVELKKTIANGDGHCHIVIHLEPSSDDTGALNEYFG